MKDRLIFGPFAFPELAEKLALSLAEWRLGGGLGFQAEDGVDLQLRVVARAFRHENPAVTKGDLLKK